MASHWRKRSWNSAVPPVNLDFTDNVFVPSSLVAPRSCGPDGLAFPLPSFQCSVRGSRHALRENLWQLSVSETDIRRHFWKSGYTELAEAASLPANTLTQRFEDDQVFEDHAKICLHIGRIPSEVRAMDWND